MRIAVDTLDQFEALFASIKVVLERAESPSPWAIQLATVGADLAVDRANLIGCARDQYRDRLLSRAYRRFCSQTELRREHHPMNIASRYATTKVCGMITAHFFKTTLHK